MVSISVFLHVPLHPLVLLFITWCVMTFHHILEPTTGLDPLSRRRVWETINNLKKDRVVVLTTHNMEEADFLGDTIMIMHGGRGSF